MSDFNSDMNLLSVDSNHPLRIPRNGRSVGDVWDINRRSSLITGTTPYNSQRRNSQKYGTLVKFAALGTKHRLINSTGDDVINDVMIPMERARRGTVHGTNMALQGGSKGGVGKRRSDPSNNATSSSQLYLLMHMSALERKKSAKKSASIKNKYLIASYLTSQSSIWMP